MRIWLSVVFLFVSSVWSVAPAYAIPAFSRARSTSCSTCHDPFPSLNARGRAYEANAFAFSTQGLVGDFIEDGGDGELSLLAQLPLAIRMDLFADLRATGEGDGEVTSDFAMPWLVELLSGGRIAPSLGYYLALRVDEQRDVALGDAFLHFNDVFSLPIDVITGHRQVADWVFEPEQRLTFQDYALYRLRPGESRITLGYDAGIALSSRFDFGLWIVAQAVNGVAADDASGLDLDPYKSGVVRLSQSLGPVRIGLLGYYGREQKAVGGIERNNYAAIGGPDISMLLGRLRLDAQWLRRWDANPFFLPRGQWREVQSDSFLVQAVVRLLSEPGRLYAVFLFNYVDNGEAVAVFAEGGNQESYTGNLTYLLYTNIKTIAEYTFAWVRDGRHVREHRALVGVSASF